MSRNIETQLPWPEIRLHFTKQMEEKPTLSAVADEPSLVSTLDPISLDVFWTSLRSSFQGKYNRYISYIQYLSTDFSGGFKVCSFLTQNRNQDTFQFPFSPPGPPISLEMRNMIWLVCKRKEWEEVEREDWELLGISFLLTGDITDFKAWVEMTKKEFGLSEDCKRFLTLLGWEEYESEEDGSILQSLVNYSRGKYEFVDYKLISNAVLKEGYWQLSGVLLDSISKLAWKGKDILKFLQFLSGFYSEWQDWEQAKFKSIVLGKVPAFSLVRYAKKLLPKNDFSFYLDDIKKTFRGDLEEEEVRFGYNVGFPFDPFLVTLLRYDKEKDRFEKTTDEEGFRFPYSYFSNLQIALVQYRKGNLDSFFEFYEKGGRLRFLPIPLYLYARALQKKGETEVADSILLTLEKMGKSPVFPDEMSDI
ncbi:LBF_1011 family protein [Leptospira sp. 'Mane']|uniref:LBF_1011 family protein n=1 Tax=Leptospira sp. 'Mane' TaxID=3387407 RepID=UPI00398A9A1C